MALTKKKIDTAVVIVFALVQAATVHLPKKKSTPQDRAQNKHGLDELRSHVQSKWRVQTNTEGEREKKEGGKVMWSRVIAPASREALRGELVA